MLGDANNQRTSCATLRIWWSLSGLCLIAVTWRLWIPQREFPQVPLFRWACSIPAWWDWLYLGILCGSLLSGAASEWTLGSWPFADRRFRWSWFGTLTGLLGLWLVNQHRLQPWAWQLWLLAMVFASGSDERLQQIPIRWLTISIYFWSAISKLDPLFAATHGQTLSGSLFGVAGLRVSDWPAALRWWLALGLPLFELCVSLGLLIPRTRRLALCGAIALHMGLLIALGPWGLGHSPGVLAWNLAFIGHDWLLFGVRNVQRDPSAQVPVCPRSDGWAKCRTAGIAFACVWPISQPVGWCDQWLAWSVYSVRGSQVSVVLSEEGIARLPQPIQRQFESGELRLDRWSLAGLNVPIYPELRFQWGAVNWLRRRAGADSVVEVIVISPKGQWSVDRTIQRLSGSSEVVHSVDWWMNSMPRSP